MASREGGEADVAVRVPVSPRLDEGPPEPQDSPRAADQHQALVESLADVLEATPEEVEELLAVLREQLDEEGPLEERAGEAFERGLQLGLMVGVGSLELAIPSPEDRAEGSALPGR
ncbi:MAG TPA: hypothetical protein VH391_03910 [Solirubrobacterales bacterium]|jgi:hypothetical protein